jgi:RND family efflux transporter MFP subunit
MSEAAAIATSLPLRRALSLALVVVIVGAGCDKPIPPPPPEKVRPVTAIVVAEDERPVELTYVGLTGAAATKAYAFKQGGRLTKVYVDKGDRVAPGKVLARLEPEDMEIAQSASDLNILKAEGALKDAERTFERIKGLVAEGVRPPNDLEQAKLGVDVRRATLEQARLESRARSRMVADTRLKSEVSGYVVDVRHRAGELVGGGYPVVIVRTTQQVVKVGVAQRDMMKLEIGTRARVDIDDLHGEGAVSNIAQIPDQTSRTYEVQVALEGELNQARLLLGSVARVAFQVGQRKGIWVPIPSVLTEGENFVFVVADGRASKRPVTLGQVSGPYVRVEGLSVGDQVIVEGMKTLSEGYRVEVKS